MTLRQLLDLKVPELNARRVVMGLESNVARNFSRALIGIDELTIQCHLDLMADGFDHIGVPHSNRVRSKCARRL